MIPSLRIALAALLICCAATPARATFHIMRISEVLGQYRGDSRIQFVELQMLDVNQTQVLGHTLIFQDAAGAVTGTLMFDKNVTNGANGSNILVGTDAFAAAFDVAPDLILPEGLLSPDSGRVCFETIDCVAYGAFTGSNAGYGSPAQGFTADGQSSLTLKTPIPAGAKNNANDFELAAPAPRNNAGKTGTLPPPPCFFQDPLENLDNWDDPTDGAGIDLSSCGQAAQVDVGTVSAAEGVLSLKPGTFDFPGIGPLGLTGLKSSVASAFADESYRCRFTVSADPGIVIGAAFVRQHYAFDAATGTIDIGEGFGFGLNFSFDDLNNEPSDHAHGDLRTNCFQNPNFDTEDNAPFPGFKMTSGTPYTVILDVEGDDVVGPLLVQAKLFPSDAEEPAGYLGSFLLADVASVTQGVDHSNPDLDHAFLLAAIGSSEAALHISAFSICPIPLSQQFVRFLTCQRQSDGTILVAWMNPFDAQDGPITIALDGEVVGTVDGSETEFTIPEAPLTEATIVVTNYSGAGASCTVCQNMPPVAVIDAPSRVELQDGTATVAFDSTGSNDGDNGSQTLTRFWEILTAPPGGNASLDNPAAEIVNMNVNADGVYTIRLTLTDSGCAGDLGQETVTERELVVGNAQPSGLQKPNDENQDGKLDLSDPVSVLNHLFLGSNPDLPCGDGTLSDPANLSLLDSNGDGRIDLSDPVYVLNFLFLGGNAPGPCAGDPACPCGSFSGCPDNSDRCSG